ncbi:MAG: ParB/RepB/Spo0J family partition protein [Acetatifactor sp.]|nr:ParB/RepB/Spo0J family partition protein [Acetatifactor sp.]
MAARGLGKGLDSLIPSAASTATKSKQPETKAEPESRSSETIVKITKVEPNREQPRKYFDEEKLQELAASIKEHGMIQPILVQDRKDYYEIIAGERRWRAAKLAGLKEVPVIIRNYSEQEIYEISLIENLQREDLNPIEEALGYKRLITEFNLKQDQVAERVSKSRAAVANSIRLLKLPEEVQEMVKDDLLSTGHARALLSTEDTALQKKIADRILREKLTVRDVEKIMRNLDKPVSTKEKEVDEALMTIYRSIQEDLKAKLGTKVNITSKGEGAGKIEIEFYSHDDLDRLISLMGE